MSSRNNVLSRVYIAVVQGAAGTAPPLSYSKTCSSSRTFGRYMPARRTSLGGEMFFHFIVEDASRMAFIFLHARGVRLRLHLLAHGPGRVLGGFCQGARQGPPAGDISHKNGAESTDDVRRKTMQCIFSLVGYFGMNCSDTILFPSALRNA